MIVDTLSIEFIADTAPLQQRLESLQASLEGLRAMSDEARSAGAALGASYAEGISGSAGRVRSAASALSNAARIGSSAASFARTAGAQVGEGFAAGIRSKADAVRRAIESLTSCLTDEIRRLLGIHSPSTVAQSLGGWFSEGFALGILDSAGSVTSAAERVGSAAREGLGAPAGGIAGSENASQPQRIDLTVPLQIDGYRLGEACIRGINAVTRSTGRVLLEL